MTATQFSTVKRLKEYSFTLFHHVFWKRTIFEGVPVWDFWDSLVPKVHLGVKKMRKKKFLKGKPIWPFPFNFCEPTLSDLLSVTQVFPNPATRWRCPAPDSCNSLLISSLKTFFFSLYEQNKTVKSILICTRFNEYPERDLSKNDFTSDSVFSSFLIQRSEKSYFWLFYISAINLCPSWMVNLAQWKDILHLH